MSLRQRPEDQQLPVPNDRKPIHDTVSEELEHFGFPCIREVKADLLARKELGIRRYGTPLQSFNHRDWMQDAYEEMLDTLVYLRQGLDELGVGPFPWQNHAEEDKLHRMDQQVRRIWQITMRSYQAVMGEACTMRMLMSERVS